MLVLPRVGEYIDADPSARILKHGTLWITNAELSFVSNVFFRVLGKNEIIMLP